MREELAKKFYAAFLAQQMGISYQTAYKRYVVDEVQIGDLWLSLAEVAIRGVVDSFNSKSAEKAVGVAAGVIGKTAL